MTVYTARMGFDPERHAAGDLAAPGAIVVVDVTRATGSEELGVVFAPSWVLLSPYIEKRRAGTLQDGDWDAYVVAYRAEMRRAYRRRREAFDKVLALRSALLLCYCVDPLRCHRRVLAEIFVSLGATDGGELSKREEAKPRTGDLFGGGRR